VFAIAFIAQEVCRRAEVWRCCDAFMLYIIYYHLLSSCCHCSEFAAHNHSVLDIGCAAKCVLWHMEYVHTPEPYPVNPSVRQSLFL
jgi:hypothetical protein